MWLAAAAALRCRSRDLAASRRGSPPPPIADKLLGSTYAKDDVHRLSAIPSGALAYCRAREACAAAVVF